MDNIIIQILQIKTDYNSNNVNQADCNAVCNAVCGAQDDIIICLMAIYYKRFNVLDILASTNFNFDQFSCERLDATYFSPFDYTMIS